MRKTSGHLAEAGNGLCPFQELDSIWGCSALHPTRISFPNLFTLKQQLHYFGLDKRKKEFLPTFALYVIQVCE